MAPMRPVVMIPGLGNTHGLFDALLGQLGGKMRPHFIDLINPGAETFAQMLDHAARQMPDEPCDLLGFSMGGYVALGLALDYDFPLQRLILLNSRSVDDGADERAARMRTLALLTQSKVRFEGMTWKLFHTLVGPSHRDDAALFAHVRAMALAVGRDATAAQIRANLDRPDQRPRLGNITVPTLVIGGQYDTLTPPEQSKALSAGIPHARLEILPNCGHLSPLEKPRELAKLIRP